MTRKKPPKDEPATTGKGTEVDSTGLAEYARQAVATERHALESTDDIEDDYPGEIFDVRDGRAVPLRLSDFVGKAPLYDDTNAWMKQLYQIDLMLRGGVRSAHQAVEVIESLDKTKARAVYKYVAYLMARGMTETAALNATCKAFGVKKKSFNAPYHKEKARRAALNKKRDIE
jgi:hypothetical protein